MFETLKEFSAMFFAPLDVYEPAGMFSPEHLTAVLVCIIALVLAFKYSKNLKWDMIMKVTRVMAIVITAMEVIKISYNFYNGYTWLDAWLPLSFCSLFIYALWLSGYAKGRLKAIGDAFILIGCIVGGVGFLIFPTTSLMRYSIWHYLSFHSLFFHVAMIYLGGMYMKHKQVAFNRQSIAYFIIYFGIFSTISTIINDTTGSNIMLLRDPFNVPFKFIHELKANSQVAYTFIASVAYIVGPISVSYLINKVLTPNEPVEIEELPNLTVNKCEQ